MDYASIAHKFLMQEIIVAVIVFFLTQFLFTFCLAKVFVKAGQKWGLVFIPIYRIYIWIKICVDQDKAAAIAIFLMVMIFLIPIFYIAPWIVYYILIMMSCKKFRLNILVGILFPYIALVMMAFMAKYYYHPTLK